MRSPAGNRLLLVCPQNRLDAVSARYSIIIPAYNESARIGGTLTAVVRCIEDRKWDAEVLVVNDGSRDDTTTIVDAFSALHPMVRQIHNDRNRGKGYSVRNGMLQAAGSIVMFTDADLSSPMEEAELLFNAIRDGAYVRTPNGTIYLVAGEFLLLGALNGRRDCWCGRRRPVTKRLPRLRRR